MSLKRPIIIVGLKHELLYPLRPIRFVHFPNEQEIEEAMENLMFIYRSTFSDKPLSRKKRRKKIAEVREQLKVGPQSYHRTATLLVSSTMTVIGFPSLTYYLSVWYYVLDWRNTSWTIVWHTAWSSLLLYIGLRGLFLQQKSDKDKIDKKAK